MKTFFAGCWGITGDIKIMKTGCSQMAPAIFIKNREGASDAIPKKFPMDTTRC
jgi:hypothetical protein